MCVEAGFSQIQPHMHVLYYFPTGTTVLCACILYCHMLCAMVTAVSSIAYDVLELYRYHYIVPADMATSCKHYACLQRCST